MSSSPKIQSLRRKAKAARIKYLHALYALRNAQRNETACIRIRGQLEMQLRYRAEAKK